MKKLIACACLAGVLFTSCKKEDVAQNNPTQKKVFFYLEEISKNGEVTKTPVVVVNAPVE
ncbi:MAG TPA: hypothetical protein VM888_09970 [Chitinophagaceae bacterium]|jgi:hypothetical protein|nr:hypothetical protein [Chitinophagaceae bacterium]